MVQTVDLPFLMTQYTPWKPPVPEAGLLLTGML
jgi:hypothetical protein